MPPPFLTRLAALCAAASLAPALWAAPTSSPEAKRNTALRDTRWTLQTLDGAPVATPGARGPVHLRLGAAQQRLTGFAGCNTLRGRYLQRGTTLALKPVATTRMACTPELMEQEGRFLQALAAIDSYRIEGRRLSLLQGDVVKVTFLATPAR
ncbi:MAG TPA: META domain-containing protein [Rhizobacter sp.]